MPRPERPVDPEDGPVQRFAVELRELRRGAGNPGYRELARRAHYSTTTLAQAARGEHLPTLAVTLAYVRACGGDVAEWEARWHAAAAEVGLPGEPGPADERAPYAGFAAYGPEDAGWFHGRDRQLAALTDRVARQRFVAVVGASGVGKSSLLRAGLPGATVITPTAHPLEECAVRLGAKLGLAPGVLAAEFAQRPRNLGLAIRQLMADRDDDFLLVVDQFEEIFTLCGDEVERDGFVTALLDAAGDPDSRARVVVGLRADFLPHCARHPRLAEAVREARVPVGPMTAEELAAAITGPAAHAGLMVEKSLVATVVSEAADQPGALPFVSQALLATWRRRRGSSLFLAGYRAAGGLHGAVVQSAARVHADLGEEQRRIARGILVRLVALEDAGDTRRRVARAELGADPRVERVLSRLVEARLVTLDEDAVEIAHDALIDGWPALRTWLAEDRKALRAHRRLTEAAAEWDRHGRDDGLLYRGSVLTEQEPDLLNELEQAFLDASAAVRDRERTRRRRRLRLAVVGLTAVVAVVSLLAVLALIRMGVAGDERDLAYSRQLAADARNELAIDTEVALLLAIEAMEVHPNPEADAVLRQAVVDSRAVATLRLGIGRALGVAYSADGKKIAVTGDDGEVRVWDEPEPGGPWDEPMVLGGLTGEAWSPAFSRNGRYLAVAGADTTVRVWDLLGNGREPVVLGGHTTPVRNLVFGRDGRWLASSAEDGVRLWDVEEQREMRWFPEPAFGVALSPDLRHLAASGPDGLRVHDLAGDTAPLVFDDSPSEQGRVVFSQDGRLLVSASDDGTVRVRDLAEGGEPAVLDGYDGQVLALAFSPDGRTLATAGQDSIQLLTTDKDVHPLELRGHRGEVWGVAFNHDGSRVASVGIDGTLRLWRVAWPGSGEALRGHTDPVWAAVFTPDGTRVVSGGRDGTVRIWPTSGGRPLVLEGHRGEVVDVAVSPDRRMVASVSDDGVLRIWDLDTGVLQGELTGQAQLSVVFTPDSRRVVAPCADGSVCVWPTSFVGPPTVLPGYDGDVRDVTAHAGLVAAACDDGAVRVWPVDGSGEPDVLRGHSGPVSVVAFSPDGRRVASGGHDGMVRILPVGGGTARELNGHLGVVVGVVFSGSHLVTSGNDGTVRVWPTLGEGDEVVFRGYQASVESVAVSADGRELLTTHDDGTVRVQDCEVCGDTGEVLALARTRATRELTADERKVFGVRS